MWKLFNKLFGWEYVYVSYGTTGRGHRHRVSYTPLGERYVEMSWDMIIFLESNSTNYKIKWLTKEKKR